MMTIEVEYEMVDGNKYKTTESTEDIFEFVENISKVRKNFPFIVGFSVEEKKEEK